MIDDPEIATLRDEIDRLDGELLHVLEERARVVLQVGDRKREQNLAVYDPAREQKLLDRLVERSGQPLDSDAVKTVFRHVVGECRRLEREHMARDASPSEAESAAAESAAAESPAASPSS